MRSTWLILTAVCAAACTSDPNATPGDDVDANTETGADSSTSTNLNLPDTPFNYANPALPAHFRTAGVTALDNTPANNPVTDHGATLGRVLFYDKQLSSNRTIACGSCHLMGDGFADPARFSTGFEGDATSRNSMSIANARWYQNGRFFWDERADTLEDQVLMPIQSTVEMGLTLDELVARVSSQDYYPALFTNAFGDSTITADRISRALAQFVRAMVSYRSRYDEGLVQAGNPGAPFPNFTAQENAGKGLFFGPAGRCAGCHVNNPPPPPPGQGPPPPLPNAAVFFVNVATNNGLDATINIADNGRGDISGLAPDNGKFKSPSLRNVALTAPYMHDGRLATLRDVVQHYNTGVQAHPNLDNRLRNPDGTPVRLNLTNAQVDALVAFLGTLTDNALLSDPKFGNPFVD